MHAPDAAQRTRVHAPRGEAIPCILLPSKRRQPERLYDGDGAGRFRRLAVSIQAQLIVYHDGVVCTEQYLHLAGATADVEVTSHLEHCVGADQSEKPRSLMRVQEIAPLLWDGQGVASEKTASGQQSRFW